MDKVKQVENRLDHQQDAIKENCFVGCRVVINKTAPYFNNEKAVIAYIGNDGVSVYVTELDFDDCICLNYGEFDFQ